MSSTAGLPAVGPIAGDIAVLFDTANSLPVQLLDCDVEEPNAHLFLNPTMDKTETASVLVPEVDAEKCTLCGKCSAICRFRLAGMPV